IRRAIQPWCTPDAHNGSAPSGGYPIYSLYLDTPGREFYHAWRRGDADRVKLRVRSYDDPSLPAFLEMKRKTVDVIAKERVTIDPVTVEDAVAGFGRPLADTAEAWAILDRFAHFASRTGAEPVSAIRYEREAWVGGDDHYARVTFDRHVSVRPPNGFALHGDEGENWLPIDESWRFDQLRSGV